MTLLGLIIGVLVFAFALSQGGATRALVNLHGLIIVVGGSSAALMVNSSGAEIMAALRAFFSLFRSPAIPAPEATIPLLTAMCRDARRAGLRAIQDSGQGHGDGFMARALDIALAAGDVQTAREALERELNVLRARHREVGNVFRTLAVLSPMFGLLGTLIGIIGVLRDLTEAEVLGRAMAVAVSSALYGIAIANLILVPAAGKLRSRSLDELLSKELIMVGVLDIVYSQKPPALVELTLQAFAGARRSSVPGAA
ncbi:MAG: MotA/TolQ/ExbB proton channel family protein [Elusimicrobia bacterium]|nr:MotA/TolQ/ExbB proton channel family protein [Elusimicrobiota bacterium]